MPRRKLTLHAAFKKYSIMGIIVIGSIALTILMLIALLVFIGNRMSNKLSANKKKWWLIAHVIFVMAYFAGLLGELVMAVSTTLAHFEEHIYAAHLYILFFDNFLIIPGGFGCLITGIWLAVRTNWGLVNYYWIIAKWVGNILAILLGSSMIGLRIHNTIPQILSLELFPLQNEAYLSNRMMLLVGIAACLVILLFLVVISYLKPWGKRTTV